MQTLLIKLWQFLRLPSNLQLFVMRRFNDQFLIGVTGIILNEKNEILLFKHTYRDNGQWSLPGGYIKAKEHPKEGLEREIKEESGLTVSVDERIKIRTDRLTARLDITYMGTFIGGDFLPSKEVSEMRFFKFEDLPRLPKDQLIFVDKALKIRKEREKPNPAPVSQ